MIYNQPVRCLRITLARVELAGGGSQCCLACVFRSVASKTSAPYSTWSMKANKTCEVHGNQQRVEGASSARPLHRTAPGARQQARHVKGMDTIRG